MDLWALLILAGLLGAYHGLNPAMGWLFAVALGMQERARRAVLRALPPIAIGHELSIVLVAVARASGSGCSPTRRRCTLGAGVALIAVRDLPLRQAARALPLDDDAREPARADLVVVPDVDRARRRADGRAGADRRRRGRRRRPTTTRSSTTGGGDRRR